MSIILFGMKDIGGANAVLPVAAVCSGPNDVLFYADGVSFDRFKTEYPLIFTACSPSAMLIWIRPRVVVTTTCSPGGVVPVELVIAAKNAGIPVVAIQDSWGNHLKHELWGDAEKRNRKYLPDVMCVQDEFARQLVVESWPEFEPDRVIVTGSPAFDRLHGIDCAAAKANLRLALDLAEDWPIVHFYGQSWGMPEALRATMDALNRIQEPVYFILRDHPRVVAADASEEFREIYAAYRDIPRGLKYGKVVDSSSMMSSDPVNAGADIVMGMYTTTILEACYLRKNCLSVWVPSAQAALAMETNGILTEFPPAALGACFSGTTADEIAVRFEQIFSGGITEMRAAQEKHFSADGKSAFRVHDVIRSLC